MLQLPTYGLIGSVDARTLAWRWAGRDRQSVLPHDKADRKKHSRQQLGSADRKGEKGLEDGVRSKLGGKRPFSVVDNQWV